MSSSEVALDYLRSLVLRHSAIALGSNKRYLFDARLAPLLDEHGMTSLDQLVIKLAAPGSEALRARVIEAMTTKETSFFRDAPVFEVLEREILPSLIEAREAERSLCIWSAGCSTGQELYSVAMLLAELGLTARGWSIRLVGTDLSPEAVERARQGRYTDMEAKRGLDPARLARWFHRAADEWQLDESLRRMAEFHVMNLIDSWPVIHSCDFVLLRNVLIYFDEASRRNVLARVARVLRPTGRLLLGAVESALNMPEYFTEVSGAPITWYRPR